MLTVLSRRQLALGLQPVRNIIFSTLFAGKEVSTRRDFVLTV